MPPHDEDDDENEDQDEAGAASSSAPFPSAPAPIESLHSACIRQVLQDIAAHCLDGAFAR
jgi:hypothetical protein